MGLQVAPSSLLGGWCKFYFGKCILIWTGRRVASCEGARPCTGLAQKYCTQVSNKGDVLRHDVMVAWKLLLTECHMYEVSEIRLN